MTEPWTPPPAGMIRVVENGQERLVPANITPTPPLLPVLDEQDQALLGQGHQLVGQIIRATGQAAQIHQAENPVQVAAASLLYSAPYIVALALVTGGVLLLAWLLLGGSGGRYVIAWLVLWGLACLGALAYNRQQGLEHSAAGVARHETEVKADLAKHIVDQHIELLKYKWSLQHGDPRNKRTDD